MSDNGMVDENDLKDAMKQQSEATELYFALHNKIEADVKAWNILGFKEKAEDTMNQLETLNMIYNLYSHSYDTISAAYIQRCNRF